MSGERPLRRLRPDELDDEQRAVYDSIVGGPRAGGPRRFRLVDDDGHLEGPFNAFLLQPMLGDRLQALGSAIRYSTSLTDRARELAILVVAAHWESAFEQYAHEAVGRAVGLTDTELDAIRAGRDGDWSGVEHTVVRVVRSLVATGDLDDGLYAGGIDAVGDAGMFELLTLVGYYAALAMQMRVFRVALPNDDGPTTA